MPAANYDLERSHLAYSRLMQRARAGAIPQMVCATALAVTMLLILGVSSASAMAEPPVWLPISVAEPTHLVPGSPLNAVQTLTVDATGGTYTITADPRGFSAETTAPIKYDASAAEVQAALNALRNAMAEDSAVVTGGPSGAGGSASYAIEFTGNQNGDHRANLMTAHTQELTGGAKTATFATKIEGEQEGMVVVSATDIGGSTDGGPVTIEDTLPPGLSPTKISGVDDYLSHITMEGKGETEMTCSPKPQAETPLRCTIEKAEVITGDTLTVAIHVKVTALPGEDEMNRVTVSGGGAQEPASANRQVLISSRPAPYGPAPGSVEAGLSNRQAGAHASLTTAFTIDTNEIGRVVSDEKDIRFDLPPGLVGNTTQLPRCTMARVLLQAEHFGGQDPCPSDSMVGVATVQLGILPGSPPWGITTPIYAIAPAPGEPVAFAFLAWILPVRLDTSVLSEGNYGVRVTAPSLNEAVGTVSTWITVWGVPADHNGPPANPAVHRTVFYGYPFGGREQNEQRIPLLTNPQVCGSPMQATMSTDAWDKQGMFEEESVPMPPLVGCEVLTMQPSFSMLPDTLEAGAPAGYMLKLIMPQNQAPDGLATPTVETVTLAMPVGTVVSPSAAWGLKSCTEAQFGLHSGRPAECPRESQIGEVEVETANLEEALQGQVYLASPLCDPCTPEDTQSGRMIRIYVQAVAQGRSLGQPLTVKLAGEGSINQQTGQITTRFARNPALPFDKFELKLGGGPRAVLANPRECGPASTDMDITPWSSPFTEDAYPSYTFDVTEHCFTPQFRPAVVADMTSVQAGRYSSYVLGVRRSDKDDYLAGLQQQLPPGLVGRLAGVSLCPEPQAGRGECAAASLIGHVKTLAGPGANPLLVTEGRVYLTGPYKGAPFGLSIIVPAKAGPYTLSGTNGQGEVVVRAAINVDREDAHLTITVDPLPVELNGIPLQIRAIDVTIDRPEFTLNPTSCAKMHVTTLLTSFEGAANNVETHFQVADCGALALEPQLTFSTSGRTSRREGASLDATLRFPQGRREVNLKSVKVQLPRQLVSRLSTVQHACLSGLFDANPAACPAASRVGMARAITPILPVPLEGPAYFVSHGGVRFPEMIVVLQGYGVSIELRSETFISSAGITTSTFTSVPDVPIESFRLYLPQGPHSALAPNGNLCKSKLSMPTTYTAQDAVMIHRTVPVLVSGCKGKGARKGHRARRHRRQRRRHHR